MTVKELIPPYLLCLHICRISDFHSFLLCYLNTQKRRRPSSVQHVVWALCWDPAHNIHFRHLCGEIWCGRNMLTQRTGTFFSFKIIIFPNLCIGFLQKQAQVHPSSPTQGSKPLTPWWGVFQNWAKKDKSTPKPHTSFRNWFYICCR